MTLLFHHPEADVTKKLIHVAVRDLVRVLERLTPDQNNHGTLPKNRMPTLVDRLRVVRVCVISSTIPDC